MPTTATKLAKLQTLYLHNNQLTGSIEALGKLDKLTKLCVGACVLCGMGGGIPHVRGVVVMVVMMIVMYAHCMLIVQD